MSRYTFTLRHDGGQAKVRVTAASLAAATHLVMVAEGCPERSIRRVTIQQGA